MAGKLTFEELEQRVAVLEKEITELQKNEVSSELVILRDIAREKRAGRNNEAMLRISLALPEYPDLEDLLDYISSEIRRLLDTQGALVILLDEERKKFFFMGAAHDDTATQKRIKEIQFPIDDLASGNVIKTGEPVIVNDTSRDGDLYPERDIKFGYHFKNYVIVPLKSSERIIGVIAAFNKTAGLFEQTDMELLGTIAGTVALSIENARYSEELKKAYRELTSLDRAKNKAINHLSHELKTPVSIFTGTLSVLAKKLKTLPEESWKRSMDRAQRNLERIREIQNEVDDIIQAKTDRSHDFFSFILDQCSDLFSTLIEDEAGETPLIDRVRQRIKEIFDTKEMVSEKILPDIFVAERLAYLKPFYAHRLVTIIRHLNQTPPIYMPVKSLQKVVDGLIRNAIENTPDQGKIDVIVQVQDHCVTMVVKDSGVGIIKDHQRRIFEGFFVTQETAAYSSGQRFDFNAGGRGADLLRMKIFSEQYNFKIEVSSTRCQFLSHRADICPGNIQDCPFCRSVEDCYGSGGSAFILKFGLDPEEKKAG